MTYKEIDMSGQKIIDGLNEAIASTSDERVDNNVVRHEYRILNEDEKLQMQTIKDMGLAFLSYLNTIYNTRENQLAKTKIEEAVMWAVKGITK